MARPASEAAAACFPATLLLAAIVAFATLPGRESFVSTPITPAFGGMQQLQRGRTGVFLRGQSGDGRATAKVGGGRLGELAGGGRDRAVLLRMGAQESLSGGDEEDAGRSRRGAFK